MATEPEWAGETPAGWWAEEHQRGNKEILIIYKGVEAKGNVELDTYEEKVAWLNLITALNSTGSES